MNAHQFKELLASRYGVEVTFWAPEVAVYLFKRSRAYIDGDTYQIALMVLYENEAAFRSRISGTVKDDWLSAETFGTIRCQLIQALEDVVILEEQYPGDERFQMAAWQHELLALLRTF